MRDGTIFLESWNGSHQEGNLVLKQFANKLLKKIRHFYYFIVLSKTYFLYCTQLQRASFSLTALYLFAPNVYWWCQSYAFFCGKYGNIEICLYQFHRILVWKSKLFCKLVQCIMNKQTIILIYPRCPSYKHTLITENAPSLD